MNRPATEKSPAVLFSHADCACGAKFCGSACNACGTNGNVCAIGGSLPFYDEYRTNEGGIGK